MKNEEEELTDRVIPERRTRSASDDDNKKEGRAELSGVRTTPARKVCSRLPVVAVDAMTSRVRPQVYNMTLVERVEDFLERGSSQWHF